MSTSITKGLKNVPDGLTLYKDDDGCKNGCYVQVGLSDQMVVTGTANQADFIYKIYGEQCKASKTGTGSGGGVTLCMGEPKTVIDTESYYNGTGMEADESYWFKADLWGTADGSAAVAQYLDVLRESALGAIRETGQFHDLFPCQDGFIKNGDPDASSGCNPHRDRYGFMSSKVVATMHDLGAAADGSGGKDSKAELVLEFGVQETKSGFCEVLGEIGNAVSIIPMSDGPTTALGVANYMVGIACS